MSTEANEKQNEPHQWQPVAVYGSAACKICPQHRDHEIHDVHRVLDSERSTVPECAGLEGCHELEGVMYDFFVHDPDCPKGKTKPFSEISRELIKS